MLGDIPEVGGLQTCRTSLGDAENTLEVAVQGVEKAVTETPEEEEDGDEADGHDRLSQGQLGGASALVVFGLETSGLNEVFKTHDDVMMRRPGTRGRWKSRGRRLGDKSSWRMQI